MPARTCPRYARARYVRIMRAPGCLGDARGIVPQNLTAGLESAKVESRCNTAAHWRNMMTTNTATQVLREARSAYQRQLDKLVRTRMFAGKQATLNARIEALTYALTTIEVYTA
jgi:hypothetical protein